MGEERVKIIEEMTMAVVAIGQHKRLILHEVQEVVYRYVTPLELRIRTLCLFFFTPFELSGLLPFALEIDL